MNPLNSFLLIFLSAAIFLFPVESTYKYMLCLLLLVGSALLYFVSYRQNNMSNDIGDLENFISDVEDEEIVEAKEKIIKVEPEVINPYKPFIIPTDFLSKSTIKLDPVTSLAGIAKEIIALYKGFNITLEYVEAQRTAQFNTLLFRIPSVEVVVRGQNATQNVPITKIARYVNEVRRILGDVPVTFRESIPGTAYVGFVIPSNTDNTIVFGNVLNDFEVAYNKDNQPLSLPFCYGYGVDGPVFDNLHETPHMLIAGTTGSGKSVLLNSIIFSLLMTHTSETLDLHLADGKRVELAQYRDIPHLQGRDVIKSSDELLERLEELLEEMDRRETLLSDAGMKDIVSYNSKKNDYMPFIVFVIDEYGNLMLEDKKISANIENSIIRLVQQGRSSGIHFILSTQRPSKEVITGLIKSNLPTRIALKTGSKVDSRIILDNSDAFELNGKGDAILSNDNGYTRFQSLFINEKESRQLIKEIKQHA